MRDLRLDGVRVCSTGITQGFYRAAPCDLLLPVTPGNRKKALAEFRRVGELGPYSGLWISGVSDLGFLDEFPLLLYLEIVNQKGVDVRSLASLGNLRGLRIESPGSGIDFSWFPELEVFQGDWHIDNGNLQESRELRKLEIWHFNPRSSDLSDLAHITRLELLRLTQTNINSLVGAETLEDLRYFDVAYAPKLETLEVLASGALGIRELGIEKAKRVASYKPISSLKRLRRLMLSSCAPMPNLKWMSGLNHLDFFSFVETTVEDGDLSPLLDLPELRYVGTFDKRNYNYKSNELMDLLKERRSMAGLDRVSQ
ncbi:MAG: hypothetical protein JW809_03560 [Pirellulales bacterium]|nr:hypothetical protein [Pirellulales bacterium]